MPQAKILFALILFCPRSDTPTYPKYQLNETLGLLRYFKKLNA